MVEWNINRELPLCKLEQEDTDSVDIGSIFEEDVLQRVIMLDNGFNEDTFPPDVKSEARKIQTQYE